MKKYNTLETGTDKLNVSDFLNMYIEHKQRLRKKNTLKGYVTFGKHISRTFGERAVRSLTHTEIFLWHESLSKKSPASANMALSLLKNIYQFAASFGYADVYQNPCSHIKRNKVKLRTRYLALEEIRTLFQVIDSFEENRIQKANTSNRSRRLKETRILFSRSATVAIRMILYTGCRPGEMLSAKWEYLSEFEGKTSLRLPHTKTRPRIVSLSDIASKEILLTKRMQRSCEELAHCEWIFPSPLKPEQHLTTIDKVWHSILKLSGIRDAQVRDLRRTFASQGILSGCNFSDIAAQLGHESDQITRKFYANVVVPPGAKIVAEKVGQLFEDIFNKR